jgi:hypothetical protein
MARTLIPLDSVDHSGIVFSIDSVADVTNGNYFLNSGAELLFVENNSVSSINITLDFVADRYGRDGSKVVAVAAGATKVIGPFSKDLYNQSGEQVYVNASAACDLCVVRRS